MKSPARIQWEKEKRRALPRRPKYTSTEKLFILEDRRKIKNDQQKH